MPSDGTKTKGTKTLPFSDKDKQDSKSKSSSVPTSERSKSITGSVPRMEPVFDKPNWDAEELPPLEPALEVISDPSISSQLEQLKPDIESISRLPQREELNNDQVDLLRKYISLKETEARDLKEQARQYQSFIKKLSTQIDSLTRHNRDLFVEAESLRRMDESLRRDLVEAQDKHSDDLALLRSEFESKMRKGENVEAEFLELERKKDQWKDRVREDLKRIKLKERELENKYELLKRDTQALLDSKDQHILELRRKSDALELEIEALEERLRGSNVILSSIESKKRRLIETFRLAIALLEDIDQHVEKKDDDEAA